MSVRHCHLLGARGCLVFGCGLLHGPSNYHFIMTEKVFALPSFILSRDRTALVLSMLMKGLRPTLSSIGSRF